MCTMRQQSLTVSLSFEISTSIPATQFFQRIHAVNFILHKAKAPFFFFAGNLKCHKKIWATRDFRTMQTVRGLVDRQRVLGPIESKLPIFDSVRNPTDNASKVGGCTFLITRTNKYQTQTQPQAVIPTNIIKMQARFQFPIENWIPRRNPSPRTNKFPTFYQLRNCVS